MPARRVRVADARAKGTSLQDRDRLFEAGRQGKRQFRIEAVSS